MKINLKAHNQLFIAAELGGGINSANGEALHANRVSQGIWEEFDEILLGDNKVAFKTFNGHYLCAELNRTISTDRNGIGPWEQFQWVGNKIKTHHGLFLTARLDKQNFPIETTTNQGAWEDFTRIQVGASEYPFPAEKGRLHLVEDKFFTEDNQIWSLRGYSDFLLHRRILAGEDVRPDLKHLRSRGTNIVRIFGPLPWKELNNDYTYENFNPDLLGNTFNICAEEGIRVEFTPFHYIFGNKEDRKKFSQRCKDVMKEHWNTISEEVNEPAVGNKPDPIECLNGVNLHNVLCSYGYYPKEGQPFSGVKMLHFGQIHTPRDTEWFRKARHCQELQANKGVAIINDEPAKAIEPGSSGSPAPHPGYNYTGGKTNIDEFLWHFAISYLWTPGATFHCEEGKWGCVPVQGSRQYDIFEAVSKNVWLKIGPEWQRGRYTGAHLSSCPVDGKDLEIDGKNIWTYASLHDNKALAVRCAVSHPNAKTGWREVETWGPGNSIVRLER